MPLVQVYKGIHDGVTDVAVKKLREADTEPMRERFRREIGVLKGLRHPNIVLFMGACFEVRTHLQSNGMYWQKGNNCLPPMGSRTHQIWAFFGAFSYSWCV